MKKLMNVLLMSIFFVSSAFCEDSKITPKEMIKIYEETLADAKKNIEKTDIKEHVNELFTFKNFLIPIVVRYDKNNKVRYLDAVWILVQETEVTQAQYKAIIGKNPSKIKGDNYPVNNVTYAEAVAFCVALNSLMDVEVNTVASVIPHIRGYENGVEKEYDELRLNFYKPGEGNGYYTFLPKEYYDLLVSEEDSSEEYAWLEQNSGRTLHEVKTKKPNKFGLYDLQGNVSEMYDFEQGEYITQNDHDPEVVTYKTNGSSSIEPEHSSYQNFYAGVNRSPAYGFRLYYYWTRLEWEKDDLKNWGFENVYFEEGVPYAVPY